MNLGNFLLAKLESKVDSARVTYPPVALVTLGRVISPVTGSQARPASHALGLRTLRKLETRNSAPPRGG